MVLFDLRFLWSLRVWLLHAIWWVWFVLMLACICKICKNMRTCEQYNIGWYTRCKEELMNVVSTANSTWTWSVPLRSKVEDKPADQSECCFPGHQNVLQSFEASQWRLPPLYSKDFQSMSRLLREVVCWCHLLVCFVASDVCSAFYVLPVMALSLNRYIACKRECPPLLW